MQRNHQFVLAIAVLGTAVLIRSGCGGNGPAHDGKIRQTADLRAVGLRRGAEGSVFLSATGHYTVRDADAVQTYPVHSFSSAALSLIDAAGASQPLTVKWSWVGGAKKGVLTLPDVPDGDYKLHAAYATELGKGELDLPLPLYSPARVHVITDRPLYEPGNIVRFRAVVLRARDLTPLDGRPGKWVVTDPDGEVLLEEKAPAGDFGVVAGSFPLDHAAASGGWKVSWVSADAEDDVPFTVQPFTLPRFRIETSTEKAFYQAGDKPVIKGRVVYSSGAPVAKATIEVLWTTAGDWPPPTEWQTTLPKHATTDASGQFSLAMPAIPADLQGQARVIADIAAVDPGGDRVEAGAQVLLAQDAINVSAVTELAGGLVQGFNNRMYLRVTTADGQPMPGATIKVKRAWQGSDPGTTATLDEDSVASVQLDPGPPVTVVIPAAPWRPTPRPPVVTRGEVEELIAGEGASLADQVAMDRWLAAIEPCGKWYDPDADGAIRVGLRVNASGRIIAASAGTAKIARCVVDAVRSRGLPSGGERMYTVDFTFTDPDLPGIDASVETGLEPPDGLDDAVSELARGARDCLPRTASGSLPRALTWRATAGAKDVELTGWIADPQNAGEAGSAMSCVAARIGASAKVHLEDEVASDAFGLIRFEVSPPAGDEASKPQPTTMLGYELVVSADTPGAPATKLRVAPGEVPPLRMRVTPVLPKAGDTLTAELIRGPTFSGELPDKLALDCTTYHKDAKLDGDHHAKLTLDPEVDGWCQVTGGGVRALVYIEPAATLAVTVTPEQPTYAPGAQANLIIHTTVNGGTGGQQAAVGLFGVDASLGQLVSLPGGDDMARLRPTVLTDDPAFGVLDGQALAAGRIRGANAAAATVLRVSSIPTAPELDAVVNAAASSQFDPLEELTDHFYPILSELYVQARQWDQTTARDIKMTPKAMAALWTKALAACEHRGLAVTDAYGRRLRLRILPPDLLALTDPHVVVTGTRLPEDVENWTAWVAKEKP